MFKAVNALYAVKPVITFNTLTALTALTAFNILTALTALTAFKHLDCLDCLECLDDNETRFCAGKLGIVPDFPAWKRGPLETLRPTSLSRTPYYASSYRPF